MRVYETIVVGVDGSETGGRALAEAIALADALGSTLHIVSAYEPVRGAKIVGAPAAAAKVWEVKPDDHVRSVISQAEAKARVKGVTAESHQIKGEPVDALLEVAGKTSADVIVVGSRGMHGAGRVLGSVPNKVTHRARCSVLVVATEGD